MGSEVLPQKLEKFITCCLNRDIGMLVGHSKITTKHRVISKGISKDLSLVVNLRQNITISGGWFLNGLESQYEE